MVLPRLAHHVGHQDKAAMEYGLEGDKGVESYMRQQKPS